MEKMHLQNINLSDSSISGDDCTVLCDFNRFYGAVLTKDEELAKDWYKTEYLKSGFISLSTDGLRSLKNGFIVLVGYMRSAVMHMSMSSASVIVERSYIRAVESCIDEESVFRLFVTAFRDFCGRISAYDAGNTDLSQCKEYILLNLKSALTLTDVALHCGYNSSYLSRKFKQMYGISLKRYILNERLKCAASMLRHTDMSIAEISSMFKFSSQSHFQQEFKKNYGTTPLQFRLNAQAKN